MWRTVFLSTLIVVIPSLSQAAEARNPRVSPQNYQDCQRLPQYCVGNDSARARPDYYRKNTRQGSGYGVYRGQRRLWTDQTK